MRWEIIGDIREAETIAAGPGVKARRWLRDHEACTRDINPIPPAGRESQPALRRVCGKPGVAGFSATVEDLPRVAGPGRRAS